MRPTYHVYVSERGNVFMTEIAALVAAALADLAYDVIYPAEGLPQPGRSRINIVVAPHEFYPLQRGVSESDLLRSAESAVTIGVEQPGTLWFELGARYSSVAPVVLDISKVAVNALRDRGIPARHIQLGYHPSWDHWGGRVDNRPTDVLFLGSVAARREHLLASMAPLLWDFNTDIRLFEFPRPMTEARGHFVCGPDKWKLLAQSRVLLNIHRSQVPYFEWVRVLEAVANGCLVVSEVSDEYGPLVPGEHLVAAPSDLLGAYVSSLAIDETLRAEMAHAAYDLVRTKLEMTALLEPICGELDSTPFFGHRPVRKAAELTIESVFVPEPRPVIAEVLASETRIKARVKELMDSETALIRNIEAMQATLAYGDPDRAVVYSTPGWAGFRPDTTVVVTAYNSVSFIARAIESVFDSIGAAIDLVVVDDHSTDGSVDEIRRLMDSHPGFPVRLIARSANAGVSLARNRAFREARGRHVFILDADNRIYPNAVARLTAALDADPGAMFAYGLIATNPQAHLLSCLPWDLIRICESNYVDAMAAIRLSAIDEVGGYDPYFGLVGWEDYELWLRFAAAGWRPAFIPAFIGEYSVRLGSRQETVNLDNTHLFGELRERFPFLPWP